ncbi:SDR family NAD(P)-dependent oxidoreductase [Palleronia sediminis]|uniref:SDR family NAD(P)-dependent oxidoreductase n=1 Tax=Palleronia sediminis TaxID=2547833 RepID=A0A4R5ZY93_9RHOB|nr:NmrA family NAD(P)-binding protein [Palleronia sediminis]TDL75255.1 SDR family NAD(P)-dependent oxidoreductase [Palleronia sediminis]
MLFVMGATGRMGGAVIRHAERPVRAASRSGRPVAGAAQTARFDLDDAGGFSAALSGCDALFVMRPPPATTRAPFDRLMAAARAAGVGHVICASVYGADRSRVLPHRHMEAAVRDSGLAHSFLRPADFMQNLADIHGPAIRDTDEIAVPTGAGRSAFVDVDDIGAAAAAILRDPGAHDGRGYALTGPAALSFGDVAAILSDVLGRPIRHRRVSLPGFVAGQVRSGRAMPMALVMGALYTVQRMGRAAPVLPDLARLLGRPPTDLASYARRERSAFLRG